VDISTATEDFLIRASSASIATDLQDGTVETFCNRRDNRLTGSSS
jgi:hypothetical protein